MSNIEVSVVIPTFNRREMLREMLVELCSQTFEGSRFEVIVVVDGSTDGTMEMMEQLETPYTLRPVFQENAGQASSVFSSGVSVARNRGADMAQGDVLLFLDDDLTPLPELIEEHARIHHQDRKAVVLGKLLPTADGTPGKKGWNTWEERVLANHYHLMALGERPAAGWRLYSANFSAPKKLFKQINGFDLGMGHIRGEDVDLGFRFEGEGATFYFAEDGAVIHRGFRPFQSWCNSAYILGIRDVVLLREKNRIELRDRLSTGYSNRPAIARWIISAAIRNKTVKDAIIGTTKLFSGILMGLGAAKIAHSGYSMIFTIHYWHGVADEVERNGMVPIAYSTEINGAASAD